MSDLREAVTELVIVAGRVSIDLPVASAEELSRAMHRATTALEVAQSPSATEAYKRAARALGWLVRLKDGPRDEGYRADKPHAWAEARAAYEALVLAVRREQA